MTYWYFTLQVKQGIKPCEPRNGLDSQDLINFVCTSATVGSLMSRSIMIDEKYTDMKILWAAIPILSLFQITRYAEFSWNIVPIYIVIKYFNEEEYYYILK